MTNDLNTLLTALPREDRRLARHHDTAICGPTRYGSSIPPRSNVGPPVPHHAQRSKHLVSGKTVLRGLLTILKMEPTVSMAVILASLRSGSGTVMPQSASLTKSADVAVKHNEERPGRNRLGAFVLLR